MPHSNCAVSARHQTAAASSVPAMSAAIRRASRSSAAVTRSAAKRPGTPCADSRPGTRQPTQGPTCIGGYPQDSNRRPLRPQRTWRACRLAPEAWRGAGTGSEGLRSPIRSSISSGRCADVWFRRPVGFPASAYEWRSPVHRFAPQSHGPQRSRSTSNSSTPTPGGLRKSA